LSLSHAHAETAGMMFGTKERIAELQDVDLQGPEGEPLVLGYKTTSRYFIGGLYVRDDGYVLSPAADTTRYLPLPTGDELRDFQRRGLLPDPLPPYALGAFAYFDGYSLWLIVAITLFAVVIPTVVTSRRRRAPARAP
jgi:hypothetical protein